MTRFFLVRHAANDTSGRALAGRMPGVHLNDAGRTQARALAARFTGVPVAAVLSSPLERALETAGPIATVLGRPVTAREEFQEIEFGAWTGRAFDALADDADFHRFNALRSCAGAAGGEFMLQAQARIVLGLDALRAGFPEQSLVVVTHGDLIRAALAHYAGIHLDLMQRLTVDMASVSIVELDPCAVRIVAINDTGRERFG